MEFEDLKKIIDESKSINEVCKKIYGNGYGGNLRSLKKLFFKYDFDWYMFKKETKRVFCIFCEKEIFGRERGRKKFCDRSCAAKYNNAQRVYKRKIIGKSNCKFCDKELVHTKHIKTFCDSKCCGLFTYNQSIEDWKNGIKSGTIGGVQTAKYIYKYLFEKYDNKCQKCGWNTVNKFTNKIPLHVHHIDGDCTNSKEENLELLCPNCHSLTETFGSKNKESKRFHRNRITLKTLKNN
jgi:hypothetical protein